MEKNLPINSKISLYNFIKIISNILAFIFPVIAFFISFSYLSNYTEIPPLLLRVIFCVVCIVYLLMFVFIKDKISKNLKVLDLPNAFLGYLILVIIASIPVIYLSILIEASHFLPSPTKVISVYLFSSLFPLAIICLWHYLLHRIPMLLEPKLVIFSLMLVFIVLIIFEVFFQLIAGPVRTGISSINSPDKTFWYYQQSNGKNLKSHKLRFNSWGFRGPEPSNSEKAVEKVLVMGDSISFAGKFSENKAFPWLAESMINNDTKIGGRVEIINASIPSFSLEQIKAFYVNKVYNIQHDILVLCFYIDDVNRELRYKKNDILYSPVWPEWIQDIFYSSYIMHNAMTLLGYRDTSFLCKARSLSYNDAWPHIFSVLDEMDQATKKKGVQFAVFNIPRFNWLGKISKKIQYLHIKKNEELEKWCNDRGIPYYDTLPMFLGIDIDSIRISPADIHLTELGHKLMAEKLKYFIELIRNRSF